MKLATTNSYGSHYGHDEIPDYTIVKDYRIAIGKSTACDMFVAGGFAEEDGYRVDGIVQLNADDLPTGEEFREEEFRGIPWLRINAQDEPDYDMKRWFPTIYSFFDRYQKCDDKSMFFFCCRQGISRSATAACSVIMKRRRLPFETVKSHIVNYRSCVDPNPGFCIQLQNYEWELMDDYGSWKLKN